jgi:hypothetical protein
MWQDHHHHHQAQHVRKQTPHTQTLTHHVTVHSLTRCFDLCM